MNAIFFFLFWLLISGYVSEAAKLGREDLPICRSYSLEELKEATNNFDNSTFMGENLYGKVISKAYFFPRKKKKTLLNSWGPY